MFFLSMVDKSSCQNKLQCATSPNWCHTAQAGTLAKSCFVASLVWDIIAVSVQSNSVTLLAYYLTSSGISLPTSGVPCLLSVFQK